MLAKKNRLPLRQMPNFFQESEKFFTHDVTWFYQKKTDIKAISEWQVAIIVPKKAVKTSVGRHKYKRLVANFFRQEMGEMERKMQIVAVATKKISEKTLMNSLKKFKDFLML